jgi:tRNA pseudouridine38-40 synthase
MLNKAAQAFVGSHDFESFCTADKREKGDLVRNVKSFSVKREDKLVTMTVEADGFLYNMVRIMVGTLLDISQGRIAPDAIAGIIEKKDRAAAGVTAPACGLYLDKVVYD